MNDIAVKIRDISKTYHPRQRKGLFKSEVQSVDALRDITTDIYSGEIFGLLGPNGAGKTTLIKCLTTLLIPTRGEAWVNGYHIIQQENEVRSSVGCMLMGERGLYWKLTGRENLEFFGALYHLSPRTRRRRAQEILELLQLDEIANRTVETYSSGQKMKLAFGKALIHDAPILVLDEPTSTLDVPSARELREIVRKLNNLGKTVLYTTHIMSEAELLCDRVAIIDRGKLIALGTVEELKASTNKEQVIKVEGVISAQVVRAIEKLPQVSRVVRTAKNGGTRLSVIGANGRGLLPQLIETLSESDAVVQNIVPEEITLEDVFVAETGRSLSEDTRVI